MSAQAVTAEVDIASIAAGGDGVGRTDGMAVFVPRSAPGDRVLATLAIKGRFARGEIASVVRPSTTRVVPPCPHYVDDRCGGCQLQHMSYASQLVAKRNIVTDSLARIARRTVAIGDVVPSERQWQYRGKLTLAMRRTGGRWIAGLHPYDDPDDVFDLRECPITDERVIDVWADILRTSARLPKVTRLRGAVRLLDDGASFVLEGGEEWPSAQSFFDAVPSLRELWWAPAEQRRRLMATRGEEVASGPSFAQINVGVGEALHAHVAERVLSYSPRTVVDAYAGAGLTAARIAAGGARVTAIESDRAAAATAGARLPTGSSAVAGRVEDLLWRALPADVVVLNPPRGGVDARVAALLQDGAAATRAVVYVSCDPATLARDLARMPRFRIAHVTCFDMFPQTAHVETVCELVPASA